MCKSVLVISYPSDVHATHVLKALTEEGAKARLVNLGEYPNDLQLNLTFDSSRSTSITFETNEDKFNGDEIKSVWWRRPLGAFREEPDDMALRYVSSEAESLTRSLSDLLPGIQWISHPEATRTAGKKAKQLSLAARLGFKIPKTVMGNSVKAVASFLDEMGSKPIIIKAANSAFIRLNPKSVDPERVNRVIYTKVIDPAFLQRNLQNVTQCPFILQEAVQKDLDIRVTVVGDLVFAMGIRAHMNPGDEHIVDWRKLDANRDYLKHSLPDEIEQLCRDVTKGLGLAFGCIDLAYSERDGYTFFEINPQGQWLISETVLGYQITQALTKLLLS